MNVPMNRFLYLVRWYGHWLTFPIRNAIHSSSASSWSNFQGTKKSRTFGQKTGMILRRVTRFKTREAFKNIRGNVFRFADIIVLLLLIFISRWQPSGNVLAQSQNSLNVCYEGEEYSRGINIQKNFNNIVKSFALARIFQSIGLDVQATLNSMFHWLHLVLYGLKHCMHGTIRIPAQLACILIAKDRLIACFEEIDRSSLYPEA